MNAFTGAAARYGYGGYGGYRGYGGYGNFSIPESIPNTFFFSFWKFAFLRLLLLIYPE